ncbi:sensor histidine kinase [Pseudogemmobacter faecipullorum]|uniref:histidine kinase n=1 Tax=Pseudogemmobacter faecipullorum TaxID=2755041 RepID=A0ABS8CNE8_9RHOB|nr:HAMP domain-containing sensor histidine kinase [Pseudogemmobacter faecipullorum]MCB5410698.1 HAMP domain-containing histidine kinase [Pseudogemmobacter faecipullorum]
MRHIAGIYLLALASVASFLVLMVLSFGELRTMVRQLSDNTGENMVWMVSQLTREAMRVSLATERDLRGDAAPEELAFRLDMLQSRIRVISEPPIYDFFTRNGLAQDFDAIRVTAERLSTALLAGPQGQPVAGRAGLAREMEELANASSALANASMLRERDRLGLQYDTMREASGRLLAASLAVMAVGLGLGSWLLRSLVRQRRVSEQLRDHQEGLERIVAERTSALHEALATERHAKEIYRSFITTVSHQFRTPLAVINMVGQRLTRRAHQFTPAQVQQKAENVTTATARLLELLTSVNRAALIDRLEIGENRESIDLVALCARVIGEMRRLGYARAITLEAPANLPGCSGDPVLLAQVIENLLSNAIKYSDPQTPITLRLTIEGDRLCGAVEDQGIGIPAEDQPRIFERFHRGSNVANLFGTGVGLSLSRTVLALHGGELSFSSVLGEGSVFTFRLPLEPAHAAP